MKPLIKKNNIVFGEFPSQLKTRLTRPNSERLSLELKIPREKLQREIEEIRQDMLRHVEMREAELSVFKADLLQREAELVRQQAELTDKNTTFDVFKQDMLAKNAQEVEEARKLAEDQGRHEGHQKGHELGYKEGYAEGQQKGKHESETLKNEYINHTKELLYKLEELNQYKKEIFEKTEPYFLSLIDSIIKKVMMEMVTINPDIILKVIRESLKEMGEMKHVIFKVNPQHVEFINANKAILMNEMGQLSSINVISDATMHPGGCILETDYGLLNAAIETKMVGLLELINKTYETKISSAYTLMSLEEDSVSHQEKALVAEEDDLFQEEEEEETLFDVDDDDLNDKDLNFLTNEDDGDDLNADSEETMDIDSELEDVNDDDDDDDDDDALPME